MIKANLERIEVCKSVLQDPARISEHNAMSEELRNISGILIQALGNEDQDVRRRAADALGKIGPAVVPTLIRHC